MPFKLPVRLWSEARGWRRRSARRRMLDGLGACPGNESPSLTRDEDCRLFPPIMETTNVASWLVQSPSRSNAGLGITYQDDCSEFLSLDSQLDSLAGATEVEQTRRLSKRIAQRSERFVETVAVVLLVVVGASEL
jgi:hypothetical protein